MMPWSRSETTQVASSLKELLSKNAQQTVRVKKQLAEQLAPVFQTPENLETFRRDLERLFTWDESAVDGQDRLSLYPAEVITSLVASGVTQEMLPWCPFLAATAIAQSEQDFFYGRHSWRALAEKIHSVPAEYFERVLYNGDNEVLDDTLSALVAFHEAGLLADFVREVDIQGKALSDYGYTIEQARRLQDAGVSPEHCRLTFHRKMKRGRRGNTEEAMWDALALWGADVPWLYAHRLFQAGLEPAEVVAAHGAELPVEYAVAASGL